MKFGGAMSTETRLVDILKKAEISRNSNYYISTVRRFGEMRMRTWYLRIICEPNRYLSLNSYTSFPGWTCFPPSQIEKLREN
ncbi:hypothetical protein T08_8696 [Trichinella sp. T8]|nr:hypothetical protein T08_8696 [Trichinella sp. T8]